MDIKNIISFIKAEYKKDKKTLIVYFVLRVLIIMCMIREIMLGNIQNVFLCVLSLILFLIPGFIENKFKIEFPSLLERMVYIFIFSAEILGEINNFYGHIEIWDTILHVTNGFLCASIGFSLVYILNNKISTFKISAFFVALVSFCFSMTVGVSWEIFEYAADNLLNKDMQKDTYVDSIRTVQTDPEFDNNVIEYNNIEYTVLYDENNNEILRIDNYLDIGIHDTMEDLIVNFIGAFVYSVFGYLYLKNNSKYKLAEKFLTKKR